MTTKTQEPNGKSFETRTVLLSGFLVGTLDILSAFVDVYFSSGKNPLVVLPFIASGAFGKPALAGGAGMMVIGLLFHYLIAFSFTVFFFWIYKRIGLGGMSWIVTGILYGIFIWLIMNLIVVQLSAAPHSPINAMKWPKIIKSALILICMIGLPLSYIAHKAKGSTTPA